MTALGLTAKQRQLLTFIEHRLAVSKVSPSFEQMRVHLGMGSKSGIFRLVEALEERGHIVRAPNRPHSIALRKADASAVESPDLGLKVRLSPYLKQRLDAYCSEHAADPANVVAIAVHAFIAGGRS